MLKETIKYTDFNGKEQKGDFYFNLSKSEVAKLELSKVKYNDGNPTGGFAKFVEEVIAQGRGEDIINLFEILVKASYGKRNDDGFSFDKNAEQTDIFMNSAAYDQLFMDLVTNAKKAEKFFKGIMPADLGDQKPIKNADTPDDLQERYQKLMLEMKERENNKDAE